MIKVLVVDDSFVMRKLLSDILNSGDIKVAGAAKSGSEALKKIPGLRPDVITLDLVMPGWDGLTTLEHIMKEYPTPVIILSAHSREGADITLQCLEAGAVDFILKPSGELSLDIDRVSAGLLAMVSAAAKADVARLRPLSLPAAGQVKYTAAQTGGIIVIGASTGGPQTLVPILSALPPDFSPPVIVMQHMPCIEFTQSLTERLKRSCKIAVKVAEDNEVIADGNIYLIPGGYSMTLEAWGRGKAGKTTMRLAKDKPGALTPSINTTMKSAAGIFGSNAIGVILTGMGSDGAGGMEAIKNSGGRTLVQDESSLIFGMPKAVIDLGCADSVLPADGIAGKIAELVSAGRAEA